MDYKHWDEIDQAKAAEISRLAEVRVAALMTVSLAVLQRAMTFASITATSATATLGVAMTAFATLPDSILYDLKWPALVASCFFWLSCALCVWAARPLPLHIPGKHPVLLCSSDDYMRGPLQRSYGWDAESYQEAIDNNEASLKRNGRLEITAIIFTLAAPFAAGLIWLMIIWRASA